jgi:surface antigen
MTFCFSAQALVCLTPSLRPSSTELMPSLAVATSHTARNQAVSGSLVAWKTAPAVSATWWRQARHWIFGRVLSHSPSHPPHSGQTKPAGQRSFSTTARHCSSVP